MIIDINEYFSVKENRLKGGKKVIDVITVALGEDLDHKTRMFHCMLCGTPLFQYVGKIVKVYPGEVPTEVPLIVRCSRAECKQNYLIEKILSREPYA